MLLKLLYFVYFCCIYFFLHCWHSVDSKRKNFIVQENLFPYCANDIKHFELVHVSDYLYCCVYCVIVM